jgi:hypothetical protein
VIPAEVEKSFGIPLPTGGTTKTTMESLGPSWDSLECVSTIWPCIIHDDDDYLFIHSFIHSFSDCEVTGYG